MNCKCSACGSPLDLTAAERSRSSPLPGVGSKAPRFVLRVRWYVPRVDPARIWRLSSLLHRRGWPRTAKLLKAVNVILFRCFLPPEAEVGKRVVLYHRGMGVVVHQMARIGDDVNIAHNVTIGVAGPQTGPSPRIIVEDGAMIGVGAVVLATNGKTIRIGKNAAVGANAVVTHDVPDGARVAGPSASTTVKR